MSEGKMNGAYCRLQNGREAAQRERDEARQAACEMLETLKRIAAWATTAAFAKESILVVEKAWTAKYPWLERAG